MKRFLYIICLLGMLLPARAHAQINIYIWNANTVPYNGGSTVCGFELDFNRHSDNPPTDGQIASYIAELFVSANPELARRFHVFVSNYNFPYGQATIDINATNYYPTMRSYTAYSNGTPLSVIQAAIPGGMWTFNVTGDGNRSPANITLSNSQPGGAVTYSLMRGSTTVETITGTGQPITFATQTTPGTYTVNAKYGTTTKAMTGSVAVSAPSEVIFTGDLAVEIRQAGNSTQYPPFALSKYSIIDETQIAQRVHQAFIASYPALSGKLTIKCVKLAAAHTGTLWVDINTPNLSPEDVKYVAKFGSASRGEQTTFTITHKAPADLLKFSLSGNGQVPATLTLSGSQPGVNYQLLKDGNISGAAKPGTGSPLTFTNIIDAGTYTVEAQYQTRKSTMYNSVRVTEPTTLVFSTIDTGKTIPYDGGTATYNFTLATNSKRDGAKIAQDVQNAFTKAYGELSGKLRVTAIKTDNFAGSLTFNLTLENLLPSDKTYSATVGGKTITFVHQTIPGSLREYTLTSNGQTPATLTLSGSQAGGVTYQLLKNNTAVGAPVAGTGNALRFSNIVDPGVYTVRAQYNALTRIMKNSITVRDSADIIFFSGDQTVEFPYQNGPAQTISFAISESSNRDAFVIAQAVQNAFTDTHPALAVGLRVTGTKSSDLTGTLTFNLYTVNTSPSDKRYTASVGGVQYTIVHKAVSGSLLDFTLTGNGQMPAILTLSGSQADGVTYQLMKDGRAVGAAVNGTGDRLNFTNIFDTGTYTVQAKYNIFSKKMSGSVVVEDSSTLAFLSMDTGKEFAHDGGTQTLGFTLASHSMRDAARIAQAVQQAFIAANPVLDGGLTVTCTKAGDFTGVLNFKLSLVNYSPMDKQYSASVGFARITFIHRTIPGSFWTYDLTGNGKMPATLTLSGSQADGVSYQLYKDGMARGTLVAGTGNAMTFANITDEGEYTVEARYGILKKTMNGSVNVVTPPIVFTHVESAKTIGYEGGSQTINFTVSADSHDDFDAIAREVQAAFRKHADIGTNFTVTAAKTSANTGVFTFKFDNVNRYTYPKEYSIELGGKTIGFIQDIKGDGYWTFDFSGDGNDNMVLNGSQPGVTYSLRKDGRVIDTRIGTTGGLSLYFSVSGGYTEKNGVYDIVASYDSKTWMMNGYHAIANDPGLHIFYWDERTRVPYTGGTGIVDFEIPNYSESNAGIIGTYLNAAFVKQYPELYGNLSIRIEWLANSVIQGIVYISLRMQNNGVTSKQYFIRNGEVSFYHACADNSIIMYNLTGDNNRPATLTLSGSQERVSYQLLRNGSPHGSPINGTGGPLRFASINSEGYYKVVASFSDRKIAMNGGYRIASTDLNLSQDNYIVETTVIKPIGSDHNNINSGNSLARVTYLDGLQKPKQIISVGASPIGGNIINQIEYDFRGRSDVITYLPYVTPNDNQLKRPGSVTEQKNFYLGQFPDDPDNSYTTANKVYDRSPLGLLLSQGSIGQIGDLAEGAPIEYEYRLNTSADAIKKYSVSPQGALLFSGYYAPDILTVQQSRKVNTGIDTPVTLQYTDTEGKVIATETRVSAADRRISYSVYDDLGRQRYIIPAILDAELSSTGTYQLASLTHYAYYTEYDNRGRVIKSYVPGAGCTVSLYDKKGQLIMSQTAQQKLDNKWSVIKYDIHGRVVMNGLYTGSSYDYHLLKIESHGTTYESRGGTYHGYTNNAYPKLTDGDMLNVTYYDDYEWLTGNDFSFTADDIVTDYNREVNGHVTGSLTKLLEYGSRQNRWLAEAVYYDDDYLTVQSVKELYPGGKEVVSNLNDFTGKVIRVRVKQTMGTQSHEYYKWMDYDDYGRLLSVDQQITGDVVNERVNLASYTYDELGNIILENIHNNSYATEYKISTGGQRMGSSSADFSYTLGFDKMLIPGVTPRRDGNLTNIVWTHSQDSGIKYGYNFDYDSVGQLTSSVYAENGSGTWSLTTGKYDEKGITYDLNGNILSLSRNDHAGNIQHDLTYRYANNTNGNAITGVTIGRTAWNGFRYDADGNMILDAFNSVAIEYNVAGLPQRASSSGKDVRYVYNARGEKLATQAGGTYTYYTGVMVYTGANAGSASLSHIINDKGTIAKTATGYQYNYFQTDHLGNTRVVLAASKSHDMWKLKAVQTTDYYPYGLAWSLNDLATNKYLFSGKEIQDAAVGRFGLLGYYDFDARYYDPVLGRWFNQDPALQFNSPYVYCGNNPVMQIDPDGELGIFAIAAIVGAVSGIINVAANWKNIDGFTQGLAAFGAGFVGGGAVALTGGSLAAAGALGTVGATWGMIGVGATAGAVTSSTNDIIGQTGKNFSGSVDWGQVGKSAGVGAVAGGVGTGSGLWAVNSNLMVNSVSSPLLRTAMMAPVAGGASHITGGTTAGLLQGNGLATSFSNSFDGIGKSMIISTGAGLATTTAVSLASGINPINGKIITPSVRNVNFAPDPNGDNVTLYRAMSGNEGNGPLFMTDDPAYASQYGSNVQKIVINRAAYQMMDQRGGMSYKTGQHINAPWITGKEVIISDPLMKSYILNNIRK